MVRRWLGSCEKIYRVEANLIFKLVFAVFTFQENFLLYANVIDFADTFFYFFTNAAIAVLEELTYGISVSDHKGLTVVVCAANACY